MRRGLSVCLAPILALGILTTAQADTPAVALGDAESLVLLSGGNDPAVRILNASDEGLTLELEIPALHVQALEIGGEVFHALEIAGGGFIGDEGAPMLPTYSQLIQIPDRSGVSIEVRVVETQEFAGYRPLPAQGEETGPFVFDEATYTRSRYAQTERVQVGSPALMRGLRVVPITFSPVRYDADRQTLEVASRIEVEITFEGEDPRNVPLRTHAGIPPSFADLYSHTVINYDGPRGGQSTSLGTYVIIAPTGTTIATALEPLIEWRTRKGFDVHLHQTVSDRNAIKSWLQTAYDTWVNPPEYICIIGDTSGSVAIQTWPEHISGYGGDGDHYYVELEGNDVLPDAHIGRISVDSVARLELYVHKIVSYESTPYMDETSWYTRGGLAGDPSISGPTCVHIMQWLKPRLIEWGYTEVDTLFSGVGATGIRNMLNRGDTVFCYRGWLNMSGFSTSDIAALTNGRKMPYAIISTCGTGSFDGGYARSEAFIRAGLTGENPQPTGGIASIGTATTGTHTRYNNCFTYGCWRSIFWEDGFTFGESMTRGKLELYQNYQAYQPERVEIYSVWNNLMGDVAGEMWTGVPQPMSADHDAEVALGANSVIVDVTAGGYPCEGAFVCLWKGDETHAGGYTGADGSVELQVNTPSAGTMKLTVTKHDHLPYLADIDVAQQSRFVGYVSHTIDDGGDGQPNPAEMMDLPVQVQNFGTQTATGIVGTLGTDDPYVTILDSDVDFGTLGSGQTAWGSSNFTIEIDGSAPNGHVVSLGLDLASGGDVWRSVIEFPVVAAAFTFDHVVLNDFGTRIDPGESGEITVYITNTGDATGSTVTATLESQSSWVSVTDDYGTFGSINPGATGNNDGNRFRISAASECFQGHVAPMTLHLEFSGGAVDVTDFVLTVGQAASDDPTGPDSYGYYAFDNTDTGYSQAPIYDWVEIATNYGGSGTDCGLSDFGGRQGDSKTFDMPFPFTYYGATSSRVTICSNGWMAMQPTTLINYRNWNIPCAGAPEYMIAPMWDGHYQSGDDKVYRWYDSANHRFIVQWSRLRNDYSSGARNNFQVILYDPVHHPTETGDGIIVMQFDNFSNPDHEQHYSTTGIQNGDMTDGIMYGYFNSYNAGAAQIQSGRAIKFIALGGGPRGTLTGSVLNLTNGATPIEGALVTIVETEENLITDSDGAYGGSVAVGTYTLIASHPSFEPDTLYDVAIVEGETTVRHFGLIDIMPPWFVNTTDYGNTTDTVGPYVIESTVIEYSDFTELALYYNAHGAGWVSVPLEDQGESLYRATIPGQPYTSLIHYYLVGTDIADQGATDPDDAPWNVYAIWVIPAVFDDDVESGEGAWTHEVVTGGYVDEWHRSSQRNNTPGGTWSWKFGDTGGGNYTDLADGALITEPFELDGESSLTFWHWIDAENSGSYPVQAYDGGLLEISVDGGAWTQITPVDGYTHTVRHGDSQACPFPEGTPFYSGTYGWRQAEVDLTGTVGTAQVRFRFGSDGAITQEGWYIDDVQVLGSGPGAADHREVEVVPASVALYQNQPNPFGSAAGGTQIRFDLPRETQVQLRVVDATGRVVRTLVARGMPAGRHQIQWDGRDGAQRTVAAGVYFYVLDIDGDQHSRRMLILR